MANGKHRAVFLDRDGTINVEKEYLYKIDDFEFIPGAPEAIRTLNKTDFRVIVVTNQSGVARGYYTEADIERLHHYIRQQLAKYEASIDDFYYCPHHPEDGVGGYRVKCDCRKGAPGMLLRAAREHDIDLENSFMIGDKVADIEAGRRAGCQPILVSTGYGSSDANLPEIRGVEVCPDLAHAVRLIVGITVENKEKLD